MKNNPTLRIMNEVNTLLYTGKPDIKTAVETLENEGNDDIRRVYYTRPLIQDYLDKRSQNGEQKE